MFVSNPETEIEVEALLRILSDLPLRETAPYEQLSEAVGYSVQERPFALMKARKRFEESSGLRLGTVKGEGVRKLDATAIVGIGADARRKIARKAKAQAARLSGLKYNDIDRGTQQRIDAERSLLGAISSAAKANVDKVEQETATGPIVAARVFDLMNRIE